MALGGTPVVDDLEDGLTELTSVFLSQTSLPFFALLPSGEPLAGLDPAPDTDAGP